MRLHLVTITNTNLSQNLSIGYQPIMITMIDPYAVDRSSAILHTPELAQYIVHSKIKYVFQQRKVAISLEVGC